MIILPHAAEHNAASDERDVHISQAGRRHPPPFLATNLPDEHIASQTHLWPQLTHLVGQALLAAAAPALTPEPRCEASTLYSVLACDLALDATGEPKLLEVNSHCAIADGTMSTVATEVYTRLVSDVTSLLVLPAIDEEATPQPGGFEPLEAVRV